MDRMAKNLGRQQGHVSQGRSVFPSGRLGKIVLLLLTLIPSCFVVGFTILASYVLLVSNSFTKELADIVPALVGIIVVSASLLIALTGWYIWHVACNNRLGTAAKIIWVLVLLQFSYLAMAVYWFYQIWKEPTDQGYQGQVQAW